MAFGDARGHGPDADFRDKLDANPDIFAVANGVFFIDADLSTPTPTFRALQPEDCVSITAGWVYSREQAIDARPKLEAFLDKLLPVPDERRVVLAVCRPDFVYQ